MASMFIIPIWLVQFQKDKIYKIGVIDNTGLYEKLANTKVYKFQHLAYMSIDQVKLLYKETDEFYAIVYIPDNIYKSYKIVINSNRTPSLHFQEYVRNSLENELRFSIENTTEISGYTLQNLKNLHLSIGINNWEKKDNLQSYYKVKQTLGYVGAILIFMFIFMFSSQVMRGVIEEKTNRIVEILVSSVKPFQLMMGKIVGIAMVGLTQFALWIIFTFFIVLALTHAYPQYLTPPTAQMINNPQLTESVAANPMASNPELLETVEGIWKVNYPLFIFAFVFYFVTGYFLYGALFAAIGSAVSEDTENQQFILPIMLPILVAFFFLSTVLSDPDRPLSIWLSIIPFTSPIVMMARIPFNTVTYLELTLSMTSIIIGFICTTWLAAKIYKTGILMYGKKPTYKEIWKWISYRS